MRTHAVLCDFRSVEAPYRGPQSETLAWLADAHAESEVRARSRVSPIPADEAAQIASPIRRRVLRYGSATRRIHMRNSCLGDFVHRDWERMQIYRLTDDPGGAGSAERNRLFDRIAGEHFDQLYADESLGPDVLMHVTCTGYASPSAAQRLVARREWSGSTRVVHLYHMGCYASIPAIDVAKGLIAAGARRVDVVHTELCSLHLDPTRHTAEQLVAQALFADGTMRYSVVAEPRDGAEHARGPSVDAQGRHPSESDDSAPFGDAVRTGFELCAGHELLVPGSRDEMGWALSDHGMEITLSRAVPDRIEPLLPRFIDELAKRGGTTEEALRGHAIFAVHPGGPRIIDQVASALDLHAEQVAASNRILERFGNMSSATLPHIWQSVLRDPDVRIGTPVVSLAFGPGLTIAGAVLEKTARR